MPGIIVTGDTHGRLDISKILNIDFLNRDDYVTIAGDAGILWDDSYTEQKIISELAKKPFKILFVDGNHDNFDMLTSYKVRTWHGGKIRFLTSNIIHLMRGQVFNICGKKIFTFGGTSSVDI